MSRTGSSIMAVAVLVAVTIYAPNVRGDEAAPPDPSSVGLAERRAAEAFTAYNKKEYAAAIALYLEAYDASPSGAILYNIARIYDLKLHNRPSAIAFYRRYVADPSAQADLVDISNQRLRELRNAEIATAAVAEDAYASPGGPAPRARDAVPRTERPAAPEPRDGWSTLRWTGVVVGAAGLVGIGVGSGFGLAAMSKAGTAKDQCDGNACTSQQGVDAARAARNNATVANIGFAAGGALLLTGVALYFLGDKTTAEESRAHFEASVGPAGTSVRLQLRW